MIEQQKVMKCSFVIPSHNSADTLHATVESACNQTYKDFEIIIVNDGSTDSTRDYLAWLAKQGFGDKIKVLDLEKNVGRSQARNLGNDHASGDIILVLDADDLATPNRAQLTVNKFLAGAEFVHGACYRMDAVGRSGGMMPTDVFNKDKAFRDLQNGIVHSTCAYSKELSKKYRYAEGEAARLGLDDWQLQTVMALGGVKFDYIPTPIAAYRLTDGAISATRDEDAVIAYKRGFLKGFVKDEVLVNG